MRLTYSFILFLILFLPFNLNAQENDSISWKPNHFNRVQFNLGLNKSLVMGDGFLKDAYNVKLGTDFSADFYLDRNWYLGSRFTLLKTEITKPEEIGNIRATSIFTVGIQGGYVYEFNDRYHLDLVGGVGYTSYNHKSKFGTNFHDSATTIWIGPKLNYRITNFFGIYGGLEYRIDFMNIKAPAELQDYFGNSNFVSLNLGVRFITH